MTTVPEINMDENYVLPIYKGPTKSFGFQVSTTLTQCLISAGYFIFYDYYLLQHELYFGTEVGMIQRLNQLFSLSTFIFTLMISDKDNMHKVIPESWVILISMPGLQECISLFFAVIWMSKSIVWVINFPIAPLEVTDITYIYALNVPFILATLSILNWITWTINYHIL